MQNKEEQFEAKTKAKQIPGEHYFLIILLIINLAFCVESFKIKGILQKSYNEGGFLPQIITVASITMIIILSINHIEGNNLKIKIFDLIPFLFCREVVFLLIMVLVYVLMLNILHFKITTCLFLFATMFFLDKQKPLHKLAISLCTTCLIVVIFANVFQVLLP